MNRMVYVLMAAFLASSLLVPAASAAGAKNVEEDSVSTLVLGTNAAAGAAECEFDNVLQWTNCVTSDTVGSVGNLGDGTCEFLTGSPCSVLVFAPIIETDFELAAD